MRRKGAAPTGGEAAKQPQRSGDSITQDREVVKGRCPYCAEIITVPTEQEELPCPSCGATLRPDDNDSSPFITVSLEFLDLMTRVGLTENQFTIVLTCMRLAWGRYPDPLSRRLGRRDDWIPLRELVRHAPLRCTHTYRAVRSLVSHGLVWTARRDGEVLVRLAPLRIWQEVCDQIDHKEEVTKLVTGSDQIGHKEEVTKLVTGSDQIGHTERPKWSHGNVQDRGVTAVSAVPTEYIQSTEKRYISFGDGVRHAVAHQYGGDGEGTRSSRERLPGEMLHPSGSDPSEMVCDSMSHTSTQEETPPVLPDPEPRCNGDAFSGGESDGICGNESPSPTEVRDDLRVRSPRDAFSGGESDGICGNESPSPTQVRDNRGVSSSLEKSHHEDSHQEELGLLLGEVKEVGKVQRRKRKPPDSRILKVQQVVEEEYHRRGKFVGWNYGRDGTLAGKVLRELDRMGVSDPVDSVRQAVVYFLDRDGRAADSGHPLGWFWRAWAQYLNQSRAERHHFAARQQFHFVNLDEED